MAVVRTQPPPPEIEYSIYTFDMPNGSQKGANKWQRAAVMSDMVEAMKQAESLHGTGKYQKIEVKKKFFDMKKNRSVDMTLKVWESKIKKDHTLAILLVLAVLGGVGAFFASFLLGK